MFRTFGFFSPKDVQIVRLFHLLALSVPDEGYSRNASYAITVLVIDILGQVNHLGHLQTIDRPRLS
jgi:hypothetical protein